MHQPSLSSRSDLSAIKAVSRYLAQGYRPSADSGIATARLRRTKHVMKRGVDIDSEDGLSLDLDGDVLLTIAEVTV